MILTHDQPTTMTITKAAPAAAVTTTEATTTGAMTSVDTEAVC